MCVSSVRARGKSETASQSSQLAQAAPAAESRSAHLDNRTIVARVSVEFGKRVYDLKLFTRPLRANPIGNLIQPPQANTTSRYCRCGSIRSAYLIQTSLLHPKVPPALATNPYPTSHSMHNPQPHPSIRPRPPIPECGIL